MIFILFIMDISSIWGMIKDAVNVSRIFSHTELKQKFIEVSNTALNLQKRNDELEREIRQLREQQDLRHKIERTTDGYFTLKGENPNIRYCIHCWDAKHLTIQVGEDSTPGSFSVRNVMRPGCMINNNLISPVQNVKPRILYAGI